SSAWTYAAPRWRFPRCARGERRRVVCVTRSALRARPTTPGRRQYCNHEFQTDLKGYGMLSWMRRKGDRWDNAVSEGLWGSLKVARIHGRRFHTRREAMDDVVD